MKTIETISAKGYKDSLPKRNVRGDIAWTMETFSVYVNLLYPNVTVVDGQRWTGTRTKYKFACSIHGPYETTAKIILIEHTSCSCKACHSSNLKANAGIIRRPRASKEEKELATKLHSEGLSYAEIGRQLGRPRQTMSLWLDPVQRDKMHQAATKWNSENKERVRANNTRYQAEFEHGIANKYVNNAGRRLLKLNTPEFVFFDNEWHEVDRRETYKVFKDYLLPPTERKAIQELYLEAQHQSETTGVEHHVDHIWPLSVGGEHRMFNLQILPATENLSKNNTFRTEDQALIMQRLFDIQ